MKQIIKKLVLFAAVAGLAACSEEETADMSVEGIKGDFAYIVGGTEAMYQATSCEVFHTPDLEDGSVEMNLTVALTRAQSHDTSIELAVDASKISEGYEAVPDGLLRFENPVTIPAGEKSRTIAVSIAQEDFPQLTQPQYMAPFSIVAVNGVKISSNSNTAILIISTETIDPADNLINVEESVHTFSVKNYTNETVGDEISATINISGSEPAYKGFEVVMGVDNSLIAAYNEQNGTDLVSACKVHFEPMGLYSETLTSVSDVAEGSKVGVPNDPTNEARALNLLEAQGLIKLREGAGLNATPLDIEENPLNLEFVELEAAQLPRNLSEFAIAAINGNYAIEAGILDKVIVNEAADSESAQEYANILAVQSGELETDKTKALVEALTSDETREFINTQYEDQFIPVF